MHTTLEPKISHSPRRTHSLSLSRMKGVISPTDWGKSEVGMIPLLRTPQAMCAVGILGGYCRT